MSKRRTGRPRTERWRARLAEQAARSTTSRLRHVLATTSDSIEREVYAAELAEREAVSERGEAEDQSHTWEP